MEARSSRMSRNEEADMQRGHSRSDSNSKKTETIDSIEVDNSQTLLLKIATLYAERLMNDICLVVDGIEYPAHRLILCASSDVFQVMLMSPQWPESQESRVTLRETPECVPLFSEFLRYFYTGQIRISCDVVLPILSLADKYNVRDLINLCLEYIKNHIAVAATQGTLVTWLEYTSNCGHQEIAQICQNFIKWNFEMVSTKADFGDFELDVLLPLLHQSSLVIKDEMTLYQCLENWIDHQSNRLCSQLSNSEFESTIKSLVIAVMKPVRFPMMSPRQLAELLLSPLTKKYEEFFVERMAIGMAFHSGYRERVNEVIRNEDDGALLFEPRLYTVDTCSSLLTIENFHSLPSYYTRTLVFSSHSCLAEYKGDRACEWVVDIYPKGVWFKKFFLIVWQGTVEMPEHVLRSVRLSLTCKEPPVNYLSDMRVKIGILIYGLQDGVEHIIRVTEVIHRFNTEERVLNLDDVLPFDELNPQQEVVQNGSPISPFLVGRAKDMLKLHIVISPVN